MANILDYIEWRGDLPLSSSPFNEIDALILCQISYLDFSGLLKEGDFSHTESFSDLSSSFCNLPDFEKRCDLGSLINPKTLDLFLAASKANRFSSFRVTGYVSVTDLENEEQFSAITFILPDKTAFTAFRGTDDSLVGWKEDFNLAIKDEVPAQKDAVLYLEKFSSSLKGKLRLGGHSKGGNLSVYAASCVGEKNQKRIIEIFNFDGPGFSEEKLCRKGFSSMSHLVRSFYPQCSVVGMIFSHEGSFSVVKSDEFGLMQHDPFSWHLVGSSFVLAPSFDEASKIFRDSFSMWMRALDIEKKELFIETLFNVIQATDAKTNSEIEKNIVKNSGKIVSAILLLDPALRRNFLEAIQLLFKATQKNLPGFSEIVKESGITFSPFSFGDEKKIKG